MYCLIFTIAYSDSCVTIRQVGPFDTADLAETAGRKWFADVNRWNYANCSYVVAKLK